MTTQDRFEDRLLEQLQRVVADRPAPAATLPAPPARRPRRAGRLLLAGGALAAVAATVAAVSGGDHVTTAAYAVQAQPGGAVAVSIHSLSDADGLQRRLRAAGVPAVVDYVPGGGPRCAGPGPATAAAGTGVGPVTAVGGAAGGRSFHTETGGHGPSLSQTGSPPPAGARQGMMSSVRITPDGATFTIDPGHLPPGQHVYITTSTGELSSVGIGVGRTPPPAGPCPAR